MSDRELLELAAKAAGYDYKPGHNCIVQDGIPGRWNPLTDDGDAHRLAVKLELGVISKRESDPYERNVSVVITPYTPQQIRVIEKHKGDQFTATRRAIVRAAAEIGRAMP